MSKVSRLEFALQRATENLRNELLRQQDRRPEIIVTGMDEQGNIGVDGLVNLRGLVNTVAFTLGISRDEQVADYRGGTSFVTGEPDDAGRSPR